MDIETIVAVAGGAVCGAVVTITNSETKTRRAAIKLLLKIVATVGGLALFVGHMIHKFVEIPHPISETTAAFVLAATVNQHREIARLIADWLSRK
jgi:type III secretory pathway component EscS